MADLREQFKSREDLAEVVHVLHHGKHFTVYIAIAKSTGLKVLLKAYDIGELVSSEVHSFSTQMTHYTASCIRAGAPPAALASCLGLRVCAAASGLATLLPFVCLCKTHLRGIHPGLFHRS